MEINVENLQKHYQKGWDNGFKQGMKMMSVLFIKFKIKYFETDKIKQILEITKEFNEEKKNIKK